MLKVNKNKYSVLSIHTYHTWWHEKTAWQINIDIILVNKYFFGLTRSIISLSFLRCCISVVYVMVVPHSSVQAWHMLQLSHSVCQS